MSGKGGRTTVTGLTAYSFRTTSHAGSFTCVYDTYGTTVYSHKREGQLYHFVYRARYILSLETPQAGFELTPSHTVGERIIPVLRSSFTVI